jgi:hypothetical protein
MIRLRSKITFVLLAIFLIAGCGGGGGSSDAEKRPTLNEDNIVNTSTEEKKFEADEFSGGVIQKDVEVVVKSDKGEETAKTVIPAGTEFKDEAGKVVEVAPTFAVVQKESVEETVKDGKKTTKNVVKTELKFTDKDGKKIIPSEPVTVTMKAPAGSKPGDEVLVDIPDGATISKKTIQEKLTLVIVDENGNINVTVTPHVFEGQDVVVIVVQRKIVAIYTGGTGGN